MDIPGCDLVTDEVCDELAGSETGLRDYRFVSDLRRSSNYYGKPVVGC